MDTYIIDGSSCGSLKEFHEEARKVFDFGEYYGANDYALRDFLATELARPLHVIWKNATYSKRMMGIDYDRIVSIFQEFVLAEQNKEKRFLFSIRPFD